MNIFIACAEFDRHKAEAAAEDLRRYGYRVFSRWHDAAYIFPTRLSVDLQEDIVRVQTADIFVSLGSYDVRSVFLLGVAHAAGAKIFLVGHHAYDGSWSHIPLAMSSAYRFESWDQCKRSYFKNVEKKDRR